MRTVREAQTVIAPMHIVNMCEGGGSCILNTSKGCGGK